MLDRFAIWFIRSRLLLALFWLTGPIVNAMVRLERAYIADQLGMCRVRWGHLTGRMSLNEMDREEGDRHVS